jgi:predicted DNA-binding ribbon-helix-helix protein
VSPPPKKSASLLVRRSIYIWSRKSSVYVECAFWDALREIADAEGLKLTELIAHIDTNRCTPNLSSAIRLFVLDHYRTLVELGLAAGGAKGRR